MNYTTLEQSKKLAEVWKDAETGKCWWYVYNHLSPSKNKYEWLLMDEDEDDKVNKKIPAHTLETLLERLPAEIGSTDPPFGLVIEKCVGSWIVGYKKLKDSLFVEEDLLTALCDLAFWLFKNGYLKEESK